MKLRWVNRLEKSKKSWKNLTETNRNPSFFMFTSPATAYFKAQLKLCSMKMIPIPRWDTSTWSPNSPRFRSWITTTSQQCSTAVVKRCPRSPLGALANRTTQAVNLTKTWFYCLSFPHSTKHTDRRTDRQTKWTTDKETEGQTCSLSQLTL